MVVFPRIMITIVGLALLTIMVLAGRDFFPHNARIAETAGFAIGVAINVVLQQAIWSNPVSR